MSPLQAGDGVPPISVQAVEPPVLSVVVPCYNESDNVDTLFERLESVLDALGETYEIVCVDDGSRDDTLARLAAHHERNPAIKVVGLARNFGKEIALTAGIDHAAGQAVVPIDADLQDPPEVIGQLSRVGEKASTWSTRGDDRVRGRGWVKRATANLFYRVIDRVSEVPIPRDTGDFRLMDRRVVEALKRLPERTRFMKGLFAWVGFRQTAVEYDATHACAARRPGITGGCGTSLWRASPPSRRCPCACGATWACWCPWWPWGWPGCS